jgi:uncharacterized repeat protein (TIGR03803 family)
MMMPTDILNGQDLVFGKFPISIQSQLTTKQAGLMQKIAFNLLALCFVTVSFAAFAQSGDGATARAETILYSFKGGTDGGQPFGRMIFDKAGSLYGTTVDEYGGNGTVYKLSRKAGRGWIKTILYRFQGGTDGSAPTAGLVFDSLGNLYGTTGQGGKNGQGTVFELTPNAGGGWTETVLHDFGFSQNNKTDGFLPVNGLIFDQPGNLYGMTPFGGSGGCNAGCGIVFKVTKTNSGWKETVIHTFDGADGYAPQGALIVDNTGNLYGTANATGNDDRDGVVFRLHPTRTGWTYSVLHLFYNAPPKCTNGSFASVTPTLVMRSGNLYGTAEAGGPSSCIYGTVWELSPSAKGMWKLTTLYDFTGNTNGADAYPVGGLVFDKQGNVDGVTVDVQNGGNGLGTVFKLTPNPVGPWTKTVLHYFKGAQFGDGSTPVQAPIFDRLGNLYGTTVEGGFGKGICSPFFGCGTIYRITP